MDTVNLMNDKLFMTFGTKLDDVTPRDTVVAVIYDPSSNKYLCQYWEEYHGLTCLLSGGIEENEDGYKALEREIVEETGYIDFTIAGILGGQIETYYTKSSTDENFVKYITPYLVILNSLSKAPENKEADEAFENIFKQPKEIIALMERYEAETDSILSDHKEVLLRGVSYLAHSK